MGLSVRVAYPADAADICRIYNQGIEDRVATFETRARAVRDIEQWLDSGRPLVVVERERRTAAFAASFEYRPRSCYDGVAEFSVYVERRSRGLGAGRMAMAELIDQCRRVGTWKLVSRVFPENRTSLLLLRSLGFREVGIYRRHGQLDGEWRDVVIVECLIHDEPAAQTAPE